MQPQDTVLIPLRARDGSVRAYALVDAADAEWANQWQWRLSGDGYAERGQRVDGRKIVIRLNRAILGLSPDDGAEGDHIDHDRLNNRRGNLRAVTKTGNRQNTSSNKVSSSKHRGVSWYKAYGKWEAYIRVNGKQRRIGYFADEEEAAVAARGARLKVMAYATD